MTSTYDHRIIQGAESGQFLQVVEAYLQGEHGFYEQVFADLGVELGAAPAAAGARRRRGRRARRRRPRRPPPASPTSELLQAVQAATSLIKAHRTHGHLAARLDPLGSEPEGDPALDPEPLEPDARADGAGSRPRSCASACPGATLADALPHLRETYCGTIAYEIEHIASHRQRIWLREKIETGAFRKPLTNDEQRALLRRLTQVDSLERFMHKAYLGQKQFSIEGLDMTVPMLDEMIQLVGRRRRARGRHRHGPPRPAQRARAQPRPRRTRRSSREFEGASSIEAVTTIPQGGTGDVKYHHGAQGTYQLPDGESILVRLESNPSHLEYVAPGRRGRHARGRRPRARARTRTATPTPRSRSSCTATPPSPARASSRRRSTCRRSTATRSAARCT